MSSTRGRGWTRSPLWLASEVSTQTVSEWILQKQVEPDGERVIYTSCSFHFIWFRAIEGCSMHPKVTDFATGRSKVGHREMH